jgi:hypothetical protein
VIPLSKRTDEHGIHGETEASSGSGCESLRGSGRAVPERATVGGAAGLPGCPPTHAAVRRAVSGGRCGTERGGQQPPVPAGTEGSLDPSEEPIGPLPLRLPPQVETVPWPGFRGLNARWGGLVDFGAVALIPVDGTRIVEPWALRLARSAALTLGAWGLAVEIRARYRLALWISHRSRLWIRRLSPYTSLRIQKVGDGGGLPIKIRPFSLDQLLPPVPMWDVMLDDLARQAPARNAPVLGSLGPLLWPAGSCASKTSCRRN